MMLAVDVDNNCVRFAAEAVPLYEPLIGGNEGGHGHYGGHGSGGTFMKRLCRTVATNMIASGLLFLASVSTLGLILFVAFWYDGQSQPIHPPPVGDPLLDKLIDLGWTNVEGWRDDPSTPQHQAWQWMRSAGQTQTIDGHVTSAMIERFGLITLYAATNGPKWTRVYSFLGRPGSASLTGLNSTCDDDDDNYDIDGQDTFHVMVCDDDTGSLTMLTLGDNMMEGTLPAEIGLLTNLELLDLVNNKLHGTIPTEVSALTNLKLLNVAWNELDGPVPANLRKSAHSLDKVFLEHNGDGFANNVNEALCMIPPQQKDRDALMDDEVNFFGVNEESIGHDDESENDNKNVNVSYADLITSCNIPDCLCCTSCED